MGDITGLKATIAAGGLLQPLVVRPQGKRYELVAGHRRRLAVEQLGWTHVPAVIRVMTDEEARLALLVENNQRLAQHDLDEAEAMADAIKAGGLSIATIAERIGLSTRYVYDSLTLLKLIPLAKTLFLEGKFERGHAIELARLTKDQQDELVDEEPDTRHTGLWLPEHVERDPRDEDQEDLDLEDPRKVVSVRELRRHINEHYRADPATIDPVLFPDTVAQLAAAAALGKKKGKVVHITYEYRVPDAARDPKIKTYGEAAWKRADGQFHSKPCDHAVLGLVVAGPCRGEAFPVCVAKEKCPVHWADWQKEHARRQTELSRLMKKEAPAGAKGAPAKPAAPAKPLPPRLTDEEIRAVEQATLDALLPQWLAAIRVLAADFAKWRSSSGR